MQRNYMSPENLNEIKVKESISNKSNRLALFSLGMAAFAGLWTLGVGAGVAFAIDAIVKLPWLISSLTVGGLTYLTGTVIAIAHDYGVESALNGLQVKIEASKKLDELSKDSNAARLASVAITT